MWSACSHAAARLSSPKSALPLTLLCKRRVPGHRLHGKHSGSMAARTPQCSPPEPSRTVAETRPAKTEMRPLRSVLPALTAALVFAVVSRGHDGAWPSTPEGTRSDFGELSRAVASNAQRCCKSATALLARCSGAYRRDADLSRHLWL